MMQMKHLMENYDLAKTALQNWAYDADSIDAYLPDFRISSNAIYPFGRDGRQCFLRLAPVEEKEYTDLLGEMEFIRYLRAAGYPAMEPIAAKNGEYLLTLHTEWGAYYAAAFYGVPGEQIEDTDYSDPVCHAYGEALGRLHKLSSAYQPQIKKRDYTDILSLIEARLTAFRCHPTLFAVLYHLRDALDALPRDTAHYGLVHYDFEVDNVFFDAETQLCHVIDFDDSMYHFYALDIEQALDSIAEEASEDRAASAKAAFLAGYQAAFPYTKETADALPLMRVFCDLYAYTRLLHCLSEPVAEPPEWMTELEKKLKRKSEYLKQKLCASILP